MRKIVAGTIHLNVTEYAKVAHREREPTRRRSYTALGSPSSTSSLSLFSSFMGKRKSWSRIFAIVLIALQASLSLAKEDDKKRQSTAAPTFAPTPLPTPLPTYLPTTKPTPAPTDRRNAAKNNDKNDAQDEPAVEATAVPVAPPAAVPTGAKPPAAVLAGTSPPTIAPVAQITTTVTILPITGTPTLSPTTMWPSTPPTEAPVTNGPTWWRRPTVAPIDPAQTLDGSGSDGSGSGVEDDGNPSLFIESRTIAIPPISVVFEFMPEVVVAMEVKPATGAANSYEGRRHLNDKTQRMEAALEQEIINFLTMVLQTNTAQGRDSLTTTDLSVSISYEDDNVFDNNLPASGVAFVSGTALFTGQIAELPTQESLHENLVLYFQFWGAGNLRQYLVDRGIDVARITVLIDGLSVGSSDDPKDLPGDKGQAGKPSGEMPPSDSTNNGHDDNGGGGPDKASLYAGLSMGFMLMFVITVVVLFLRHRRQSTAQLEHEQRSAASFAAKSDRIPERIGSQVTTSNSSQEHNLHLHNDPADESLSSSSASGVVVNMANYHDHDLEHEEWNALAQPVAFMGSPGPPSMGSAPMGSPPVSSLGQDESEPDDENDSMDGSLFTGSVATVNSDMMPAPRGALADSASRSLVAAANSIDIMPPPPRRALGGSAYKGRPREALGGSAYKYDASRLSSVISSAKVYAKEMANSRSDSSDKSGSGDSSDKSGDRKSF